ncbi:MAG TPA: hypothetical protein VF247_03355 [Candidatus Krumholzibacteria bacterium]
MTDQTPKESRPDHKDGWDKVRIMMQPLGGLMTALAIAMFGFVTSSKLDQRQALETNTRLYSELMSRREEAESALRKDMLVSIISSFLNPNASNLSNDVLSLELLAYNFHESLNLKPLFLELSRRIRREQARAQTTEAKAEYAEYNERLEGVAREIARKQLIVLEGVGKRFDRTVDMSVDPDGTSLEPAVLTLDSLKTTVSIDILHVDRENREIMVSMSLETPDPVQGAQSKVATFVVSFFDFPMIDNLRIADGQRCALVLTNFSEQSADLTVVLFPGAYASLKEKPYYNEVIQSVLNASEQSKR